MAALPNISGALCSTPQGLADAHYQMPCSNAAKTRNPLKFVGVPKTNEPISATSVPKFTILWLRVGEVLLFKNFFRLSICALVAKIQPDKVARWCPNGDFFRDYLSPAFPASRAQRISDLHSKFTLGSHHVWKYGRHPISNRYDQARKKRRKKIEETTG